VGGGVRGQNQLFWNFFRGFKEKVPKTPEILSYKKKSTNPLEKFLDTPLM